MRGLSEYVEGLIKKIFLANGTLPKEIWLNQKQHPYLKDFNDRQSIGVFDLVQCYISKEIAINEPEFFIDINKPSIKMKFDKEGIKGRVGETDKEGI